MEPVNKGATNQPKRIDENKLKRPCEDNFISNVGSFNIGYVNKDKGQSSAVISGTCGCTTNL